MQQKPLVIDRYNKIDNGISHEAQLQQLFLTVLVILFAIKIETIPFAFREFEIKKACRPSNNLF